MQNAECKADELLDAREFDLKKRTKNFALRVIRLYVSLTKSDLNQVLGKQMLRSGTSVGAHYREACRARSTAEFLNKNGRRFAGVG